MSVVLKKYITKRGKEIPYLYRDQKEEFWARKRIGDKTPRKRLDTKVESIAISKILAAVKEMEDEAKERERRKIQIESGDQPQDPLEKVLLFRDCYAKVLHSKRKLGMRDSYLLRIGTAWDNLVEPFWGDLTPNEIHKGLTDEYMDWHHKEHKGKQLANSFKVAGMVLRYMHEHGLITFKQLPKLVLPKTEKEHHKSSKGRFIEYSEFTKIIKNMDARFRLCAELGYYTGMRKMEIGGLKCEKVIRKSGHVFIDFSASETKTGIPRFVAIPEALATELWKRKKSNAIYIFEAPTDPDRNVSSQVIDKFWIAAKGKAEIVGKMRFHDLRDTCASNLVKSNVNPVIIATFLGMSIKVLQEKYLKLQPKDLLCVLDAMVKFEKGDIE